MPTMGMMRFFLTLWASEGVQHGIPTTINLPTRPGISISRAKLAAKNAIAAVAQDTKHWVKTDEDDDAGTTIAEVPAFGWTVGLRATEGEDKIELLIENVTPEE